MKAILALPLLLGLAGANSLPPTAEPPPTRKAEAQPADSIGDLKAELRREQGNALNGILAFVCDRESADAAAPRVQALLATPEGQGLTPTPETWLFLVYGYGCFGSVELEKVLLPLQPDEMKDCEAVRQIVSPVMDELCARIDTLAALVGSVKDAESEARAVKELAAYRPYASEELERMGKKLDGIKGDEGLFALAALQLRPLPAFDRLQHAYVHAMARQEGGFPALKEEMKRLAIGSVLPATEAELAQVEAGARALREFIGLASRIEDKAGADAAADWLEAKHQELGYPLTDIAYPDDASCFCLGVLASRMESVLGYLEFTDPPYFGSERLEKLLEAEPEDLQMQPAPPFDE